MHIKIIRTPTEVIVKRFVRKFRKFIVWNCIIKKIERQTIKLISLNKPRFDGRKLTNIVKVLRF